MAEEAVDEEDMILPTILWQKRKLFMLQDKIKTQISEGDIFLDMYVAYKQFLNIS